MTITADWKQSHEFPGSLVAPSALKWEGQSPDSWHPSENGVAMKERKIETKTAWRELLCSEEACKRNILVVQRYKFKNFPNSGYKVMIQFCVVCSITGIFRIWLSFWSCMSWVSTFWLSATVSKQQLDIPKPKISLGVWDQNECSFICRSLRIPSENKFTLIMKFYL